MITLTTYVYIREDGKCVHVNAYMGMEGQEYVHDNVNWQPPKDWPYKVVDLRKTVQFV